MEEEDEGSIPLSKTSSTSSTLTQKSVFSQSCTTTTSSTSHISENKDIIPQCQIFTQQASGDSVDSEESSMSQKISPHYSLLSKSQHSSSSQDDYDLDMKQTNKSQFLSTDTVSRTETARSMECLRTSSTATRSFLSTSERDMRRMFSNNST